VTRRYYRALFSLPDGRLAVFHFAAAGDSFAYDHASYCQVMADNWPAGMTLRDVTFIGVEPPRATLGSLIVSAQADRRTA
jgi:hypothetical protein